MQPQVPPRAQRKRATVLFADLVGFTALAERDGPERAYLVVTQCLKLLDGVARRHGGSVDKYLGDALLAVFGHPLPVKDDAAAALETALEMRRLVTEYTRELHLGTLLAIHVGVNTGSLVAGDIRGRAIREFHVLGDAVNVAARLKARAPLSSIYVGEGTRAAGGERFVFRHLAPLLLKGKEEGVTTFELLGLREGARRMGADAVTFAEILGRDAELERLHEWAAAPGGGVALLLGEGGSGKSRLLAELLGRGSFGVAPRLDGAAVDPGEVRRRLAGGPSVVVFEDLESAPPAVLARVLELAALTASRPLRLLLLARPGESPAADQTLEALRRQAGPRDLELQLSPLDAERSRELLSRLVSAGDLTEDLREIVLDQAGGNPFRLIQAAFLAPALRSERERAQGGVERGRDAERRRTTVLFADITGFTRLTESLGDEAAYAIVADALHLFDDVARRHGGTVEKYLGDCVLALFGVPEAIEDAPRAAINAAIEMRKRLWTFVAERGLAEPLEVHSGINTGLAISGDISGPVLREFALMGEPVSVADRLKDLAPAGTVYVGDETWRFVRDIFEFEAIEPVELPWSRSPVTAWRVASEEPRLYRRRATGRGITSALVGRDGELEQLRRRAASLAEGRGAVVNLVAEAGLGKSRLVAELFASEEARGALRLEGRALSVGKQLAFHPFADLLRSWAGISDEVAEARVPDRLEAAIEEVLPGESEEIAPLLATMMGLRPTDAWRQRLDAIPAEMLERVMRAEVMRLLRQQSEARPLLLVFDDLHWADLASVELLESLLPLAGSHPILFVHAFRPGYPISQRLLELVRKEHAARHLELVLEPLPREASRLLVNNLFRQADIPHAVRQLIAERAGGNPFYVEEVVRSLIEEGAVEREGSGFRATPRVEEVVIPGTVQEVIMARVDRLALRPKQVLQLASVIGRSFRRDVLSHAFPNAVAELDRILAGLVDGQFLVPWDRLQAVEFAFQHPLIHEVTYDSLLHARREELHRLVGEAIQARLSEDVPGYHAMLAYHWSLGRDLERAEQSLFQAGDEAARSSASNEALDFLREASRLYLELHPDGGDPAKRARLEKSIALALYNRGRAGEAAEHFDQALEHLGRRVPRHPAVLQARFMWDLVAVLARLYLPQPRRRRAATPLESEVIHIMFRRGLAQTTALPTRFVYDALAMIRALSRVDPLTVPESGGMYSGAVGIFSYGGVSFAVGKRFLELARAVIEAGGSPELELYYRFLRFIHHFLVGDWSTAYEIEAAQLDANLRAGRLFEVTSYVGLLAEKRMREGRFAEAMESMERIDKIWETFEYDPARINHYALPAFLALEERRLSDAQNAAELYYEENPQDLLHLLALGCRAHAEGLAGELDVAEATLGRAREILPRLGRPIPYHLGAYATARLLVDVARLERALAAGESPFTPRRAVRRSARAAAAIASRVALRRPEVRRLVGRAHWLLGRRARALRAFERSLAEARRLGMRPDLARTHHELALRLAGSVVHCAGLAADAHREAARALYRELSLERDLTRLDAGTSP